MAVSSPWILEMLSMSGAEWSLSSAAAATGTLSRGSLSTVMSKSTSLAS